MKIIGRILIILAAALVIVGATLGITHNSSPMQLAARAPGDEEFPPDGERLGPSNSGEALVPGQSLEGVDDGFRRGRDQINGARFISAHWIRNLAVIAGLVVVVAWLERFLKIRRPRRAFKGPASQV